LAGDQLWTVTNASVVLNAGLVLNGHTLRVAATMLDGTVRVPGVVSGHGTLETLGRSLLDLLNANTFTGQTIVTEGRVRVGHPNALGVADGTPANATLLVIGYLELAPDIVLAGERIDVVSAVSRFVSSGTATIDGPVRLAHPAWAIFTGVFDLDGTLEFVGSLPSSLPYLTCVGRLDINGAELSIDLPEAFRPAIGQAYTIIDVEDPSPIVGTFAGLPEGGSFTSRGVRFAISYTGGDGNDVVLTVVGLETLYYLAEGATGAFFSTDILLANPNTIPAPVTVTFLKTSGAPVVVNQILPAQSRRTIRVDEIAGLEQTSFSTIVRSDDALPIVVERTMSWDQTGYGSHTERATDGPAKTWYFAEGSQGFFSTYVLLANPQAEANTATVRYLLEGAPPITRIYPLGPESRFTIDAGADAALRGQSFGITVTFDRPGVAERAMYFGTSPLWQGGHESAGVTAPARSWFLAEGATGTFFETFVLLANPNGSDVTATVMFQPAAGLAIAKMKTIPANGRVTLNIEQEDASLASAAVATSVTAPLPIIVERSQYWPDPASQWQEAHNSFGVTALARKWGLAEGRVGGSDNAQTYILVATPSASTQVTMTFLRENGAPVIKTFSSLLPGRLNVAVGGPDVPEIVNERFGVLIESDKPIAVERALYWDAGGIIWAAGSNATATPLP
jgi:hypothetical protein